MATFTFFGGICIRNDGLT